LEIVHKKTPKVDIDDLFGDDMASDLFSESIVDEPATRKEVTTKAKASSTSTSTAAPVEGSTTTQRRAKAPSDPFRRRSALLNKHIDSIKPQLVSSPSQKQPQIRLRTWFTMMQLAKDGEDMRKVVDLLPDWRKGGGGLPALFGEEFVREWPSRHSLSNFLTFILFQVVASN
jgi:hypothetical protein